MKHPYIMHLPHPSSRKWTLITLIVYSLSAFVALALIAIGYVILR
jgi:hypothetical protein